MTSPERLLEEIVTPDVYAAAKTLRGIKVSTRDDYKIDGYAPPCL